MTLDLVRPDADLLGDWADLADRTAADVFCRPEWFVPWADAFAPGLVRYLVARSGRRLLAILPVLPDRAVLRSATNGETPRYAPVEAEPGLMLSQIGRLRPHPQWISLSYLPERSSDPVTQRLEPSTRVLRREIRRSPFLATEGSFDAWENVRLTAGRRSNLRRLSRRLDDQGPVKFIVYDRPEGIPQLVREGLALEASGWKGRTGGAVQARPSAARFYTSLANGLAGAGSLRLCFLRVGGRAVAFSFAVEHLGVLSVLKTGFDEHWRRLAPGILLTRAVVRHCFDNPAIKRLDFLGESERYKTEWTDEAEVQVQLQLFGPGLRARLSEIGTRSLWLTRQTVRQALPLELRERVDTSSPKATARSAASVVRSQLAEWSARGASGASRPGGDHRTPTPQQGTPSPATRPHDPS